VILAGRILTGIYNENRIADRLSLAGLAEGFVPVSGEVASHRMILGGVVSG
jgi:hypothetical protein